MFHYVLHQVILNLRERRKLSQKVVALRGGISASVISKWEAGERRPGHHQLAALCQGLGCTEIELWNEHTRLQEDHYREQAALLGEQRPESGTSPIEREAGDLLAQRCADGVAPDVAEAFRALRGSLVTLLGLVEPLVMQYQRLYRVVRESGDPLTPRPPLPPTLHARPGEGE